MPAIRSINCENGIEIIDKDFQSGRISSKKLLPTDIPQDKMTAQDVKDWANTDWVKQFTDYQVQVHVFSVNPFKATVYTANLGEKIPQNWWLEE